ncbi:serine/threonine/tyrosine-interacting-like protein 2 [Brachionichthys hirsutus]|uniref:serine/threonine/tyrosine-interacting-like protein 2 n=1 Tax=Brachionichthys hirsutus TaxID=412623 RepID=UPI003604EF35
MASTNERLEQRDQTVPGGEEERSVQGIQSHYLRCPSPSFSAASESRFSVMSGSDAASIFMEPIHLSSAIAAKKIIKEELPPRSPHPESVPESMLESAEQLMVEDLYNRVRDMIDDRSPYNTPCVLDIQRAMVQDRLQALGNAVDEVWPNVFIAEKSVAVNKARLKRMGVTHILNAAHGTGVYTGESFYAGWDIKYTGIEVDDFVDADISVHLRPAAEFLDEALLTHRGKVLVASMMGASRSAVLVASYLMIFHHMTIMEALTTLRKKRAISPNEGFLKQLRELNETLMEEREGDDADDALSQGSVIDARARALILGSGGTDEEEERSTVKARSIMMEEEEDGASVMSSAASSAGEQNRASAHAREGGADDDDEDDDEGLIGMIHEWQRRNEKYQSDDWWEAQLNSDGEDGEDGEDGRSTPKARPRTGAEGTDADLGSITSEDIQAVREQLRCRLRRPPADAMSTSSTLSTSSCTSYSDLWKQRLKQIEKEAAARYHRKDGEDSKSGATDEDEGRRTVDQEVQSILSDSSCMSNFCQKNKEKMSPLERWRIKRIQFGWNRKDREDGEGQAEAPSGQDVDLTAYQSWKLRQQKRHGEENPEELLELSRGEDSATVKRRQRREEILERAKKNLEESQSIGGWETDSVLSGATVPLSSFWAGAGVAGQTSIVHEDSMSTLSGWSSVLSSASRARSTRSAVPPVPPLPAVQGPAGEPMINLAGIQSWIASVVSETLKQKQGELGGPPPSCAGSEPRFGGAASVASSRALDNDRASLLSGASYSGTRPPGLGKAASVLSVGGSSSVSGLTGRGSAPGSAGGSTRNKITTTSVPLFSLFQDQVDLGKLDAMDKEIKSEMRDKMDAYGKKKILEDHKRSTLYKKKKQPKGDDDELEERRNLEQDFLGEPKKKEKPARSHGLSGHLNLSPALEKDQNTSIEDWLESVRPPPRREPGPSEDLYEPPDASASEFGFSGGIDEDDEEDEEAYGLSPRYRSRVREEEEGEDREYSCNGFTSSHGYGRVMRSQAESDDITERHGDLSAKGDVAHHSRRETVDTERVRRRREDTEEEDVEAFITQTRQRIRARLAAEVGDDEVLAAWRTQQDAKSQSGRSF